MKTKLTKGTILILEISVNGLPAVIYNHLQLNTQYHNQNICIFAHFIGMFGEKKTRNFKF